MTSQGLLRILLDCLKPESLAPMAQYGPSCPCPQDVIQVSKKFLPGMAIGYSSSKLTLHVGDGFEFMKKNQDAFDVIITDSSDPMGKRELGAPHPPAEGWPPKLELHPSLSVVTHLKQDSGQ